MAVIAPDLVRGAQIQYEIKDLRLTFLYVKLILP